jgi:hypothetical protein
VEREVGEPLSKAMAQSAVNQVLNARMGKSQQVRWTPRTAHLLARMRCAVIDGQLAEKLKVYEAAHVEGISLEMNRFPGLPQQVAA